ncbi:FecR family protein [Sphingomonas sp.]|uniref:FecR family protein n=1 Tax=Sphingomonas sp. TaxID=28214 RepID=UPI002EDB96FF
MVIRSKEERTRLNAEASAWLARLHGPQGSNAEGALQDWLKADPAHQEAFERATELWEILPGAAAFDAEPPRPVSRRFVPLAIAASLAVLAGAGAMTALLNQPLTFDTRTGEQRMATLDDGSRIALNTDSRLTVKFDRDERQVSLDRGEAMFDVTHDAARPFVVRAGDERIKALGTSFVVRREGDRVRVTLLSGKVEVVRMGERPRLLAVLAPGERVSAAPDAVPVLDRPALESITAWRRGELRFRDTPLSEAVAEVNRYGRQRVIVNDARLAALPISGVFATDDPAEFAAAVAQLHGLRVQREGEAVLLTP